MSPILRRWKVANDEWVDQNWSGGDENPPPQATPYETALAARIAAITLMVTKPRHGVAGQIDTVGCYSAATQARTPLYVPNEGRYTLSAGETLSHRDIYGCVNMVHNSHLVNCRVWGSPPLVSNPSNLHQELVRFTSPTLVGETSATVTDCDLIPNPAYQGNYQTYGFKGGGFTMKRTRIEGVVDGGQPFGVDFRIEHTLVQNLAGDDQRSNSPSSGATHDDAFQVEGGPNCGGTIIGCMLDSSNPNPALYQFFNTIMFSSNTGPMKYLRLLGNWSKGSGYGFNLDSHQGNPGELTITGNRIQLGTYWAKHLVISAAMEAMATISGNEDYDTGDTVMQIGRP